MGALLELGYFIFLCYMGWGLGNYFAHANDRKKENKED